MRDDLKNQLDQLFSEEKVRVDRAAAARDLEAEAQAAFVASFVEKRREVITPALKEFIAHIGAGGWSVVIEEPESVEPKYDHRGAISAPAKAASVRLIFELATYKSSGRSYSRSELPEFSINCDQKARDVWFHEKTMGPGHGGSAGSSGRAKLEELSADYVQERAVAYFRNLMSNAR